MGPKQTQGGPDEAAINNWGTKEADLKRGTAPGHCRKLLACPRGWRSQL